MINFPDTYIGVMTGNSMDAVDAVLIGFDNATSRVKIIETTSEAIPIELATVLQELAENPMIASEVLLQATNNLTRLCAKTVRKLSSFERSKAIGCHGQTIAHRPRDIGSSWQILNGALLAELTGLDVICDFRARDIASGGEGAPFAPLFHHHYFSDYLPCNVINIGGIANISDISSEKCIGWDIGPGMMLLDAWSKIHQQGRFDEDGRLAQAGVLHPLLLKKLLAHPYFLLQAPKSCGREEFSLSHFMDDFRGLAVADVQATLLMLTATTIARAITRQTVFLCGGGVKNKLLVEELTKQLSIVPRRSDEAGLDSQFVEAATFAWLAKCHLDRIPLSTPALTGGQARIAGAWYPR